MIILLLFVIGAIAIPVTVECVRSPEENLISETKREVSQFVVEPIEAWAEQTIESMRQVAIANLLRGLLKAIINWISEKFNRK